MHPALTTFTGFVVNLKSLPLSGNKFDGKVINLSLNRNYFFSYLLYAGMEHSQGLVRLA